MVLFSDIPVVSQSLRTGPFSQVDVFTDVPSLGNPLASSSTPKLKLDVERLAFVAPAQVPCWPGGNSVMCIQGTVRL
ncbi:hypothetical protein [Arthrobacter methylotrophus]|uniref:Uncharacterized protein n=1 Tax=Arthrobacter methylotrophus TaxID=121291 RepID=A0ABV5UM90_9MICC